MAWNQPRHKRMNLGRQEFVIVFGHTVVMPQFEGSTVKMASSSEVAE
jgi:hypothetical protein